MKIDAPMAWGERLDNGKLTGEASRTCHVKEDIAVRIVRESDWRRIMAVVKAVECPEDSKSISQAFCALRKHLAKKEKKRGD